MTTLIGYVGPLLCFAPVAIILAVEWRAAARRQRETAQALADPEDPC